MKKIILSTEVTKRNTYPNLFHVLVANDSELSRKVFSSLLPPQKSLFNIK